MTAQVGEIRDNGGRTIDRYTIEILVGVTDGDYADAYYIGAGETGNVPNGFFMTVDGPSDDPETDFGDLPKRVQRDVLREIASADIAERLEYLRGEIRAERINWGEIAELQGLAPHIDRSDVELLQWAGEPEYDEDDDATASGTGNH